MFPRPAPWGFVCAVVLALLVAAGAPSRGFSQEELPAGEAEAAPSAPAVQPSNAAYMKPLGRLSSILGSIHFLRTLCGQADAATWREKMAEIIAAQMPNEADKRILIASFNGGYRAFESTYRQCTPAAGVAVERYLAEGAALSREISARYGN